MDAGQRRHGFDEGRLVDPVAYADLDGSKTCVDGQQRAAPSRDHGVDPTDFATGDRVFEENEELVARRLHHRTVHGDRLRLVRLDERRGESPLQRLGGDRGQVGQVARRGLQEVHDLDRSVRRHRELPLAPTVAQSTVECRAAGFESLRGEQPDLPAAERDRHGRPARLARIVPALDCHADFAIEEIRQLKPALLVAVAARIEEGHVVSQGGARHLFVRACHETIGGAHVRLRGDVEGGTERKAPCAAPIPETAPQSVPALALWLTTRRKPSRLASPDARKSGPNR